MSTHRTITTLLTALALTITGLAVSGITYAATGYKEIGLFGPGGTGLEAPGFAQPFRVAVDNDPSSPSSGDVYVAEFGAGTVGKFTATGQPISTLPLPEGTGPFAVAVDPKTGDVYVTDQNHQTVYKFTSSGEPVSGFELSGVPPSPGFNGITVDPSNGDVYIADGGNLVVDQVSPSGSLISQITNEVRAAPEAFEPVDVAVDSTGNVYAADPVNDLTSGVDKFTFGEGAWKFDGVVDRGKFRSTAIAVNPANNDLYSNVSEASEGHLPKGIEWYSSSEKLLYQFGESDGFASGEEQSGVAVNSAAGTVYVSNDGSRVAIFEQVQLTPPSVSSQPVSSVLSESAVFNGSVNPNGLDTNYHVEYWPLSDPEHIRLAKVDVGNGFGAKTLTQVINGLVANTAYRAELVATSSEGTTTSEEQSFTTQALPAPEAMTGSAGNITPYTATIMGTLNPNGIETTYHFDIGADTNYGAQIYGSGIFAEATPISLALQDLQPGTTYHYRFVASNQAGIVYGTDQTFTTAAVPPALTPPTAIPLIAYTNLVFPKETIPTSTPKTLTNTQKLANALEACKKKPASKRAACQRQAHKRYPQTKKKQATNKQ